MNLFPLKPVLLSLLFLWQTAPQPAAPLSHFRYRRALTLSPSPPGPLAVQACATLDADVFAHAAPSLKDLRLYSGTAEIPYATTVSEPLQQDSDDARILNLRTRNGHIDFDLEMPHRPYTSVILDLAARDYIAKATVSGSANPGGRNSVPLGTFTLFDLTSQHLSHSTTIPLSESTFPYLHVELAFVPAPVPAPGTAFSSASLNDIAAVKSASVPPSREAQSLYTTTQQATPSLQPGNESIASFNLAARVPVERIDFTLPPGYKGDFSRAVKIDARGIPGNGSDGSEAQQGPDGTTTDPLKFEEVTGSILRVHRSEAGRDLSAEILSVPVAIGSNMQQPALVEVHIENGTNSPLPLSVALQMRQRRICFDPASATAPLTLYYGDPSLDAPAPVEDGARLYQPTSAPRVASFGPEIRNAGFTDASPPRKLAQRPVLRWIALLGCVCIFALLVIRSAKKAGHH